MSVATQRPSSTTTATTELWRLGAIELADAIRAGRASSREVAEAHLRRIEAVNPAINAVTVVLAEQALAAADAADRAAGAGTRGLPFHGVPFTVKANIDLLGSPTTHGARALSNAYPTLDSPAVERLKAGGAIPIGRTNLPTYGIRWHTDSELWGETVNPWNASLTPGASSGGDAAALATGMTPLGVGNDTLGSLRWPAQCCGIAVLKPTLGRIPRATTVGPPDMPIGPQLAAVDGPMARRIADLWAAFEVMAGPTWRDPWSVPAPLRGPAPARPIRVSLVLDPAGQGTAAAVQDGLRKAAGALEQAGYAVDEVEPPDIELAARTLLALLNPPDVGPEELASAFPSLPEKAARFLDAFGRFPLGPHRLSTSEACVARASLLRAWGEFQEAHPLILAPIYTDLPFRAGGADLEEGAVAETILGMRMTLAVNALGLPAVALPVGESGGLPQSVQVIGARYREDLCLEAAAALEERLGTITPIDPR